MTGGRHAGRAIQGVRRKELPGYLYLLVLAARHVSRGGLAVHVRRPGRGAPAVSVSECVCVCVCVCCGVRAVPRRIAPTVLHRTLCHDLSYIPCATVCIPQHRPDTT